MDHLRFVKYEIQIKYSRIGVVLAACNNLYLKDVSAIAI